MGSPVYLERPRNGNIRVTFALLPVCIYSVVYQSGDVKEFLDMGVFRCPTGPSRYFGISLVLEV